MLRVGLVGCGGWAQSTHLPLLLSRKDVEPVALSGVYEESEGVKLASKYGFGSYVHSWEKMAEISDIEAVLISTPHALHYEQIKGFLNAGKHVHVDKPPTLTADQFEEVIAIADEKELILSVHAQMKYAPGMTKLRQLIDLKFSDIYQVNAYIWQQLFDDFGGSWRSIPKIAGGGIMMDSGYHMIDTVHFLLHNKKSNDTHFLSHKGGRASDSVGLITYTMGQTIVTISSVRGAPDAVQGQRIEIFGDGGYIQASIEKENGLKHTRIMFIDEHGKRHDMNFPHKHDFKSDPLSMFLDAALYSNIYVMNEIRVNNAITLEVVRVLEAAYKKEQENGDVL